MKKPVIVSVLLFIFIFLISQQNKTFAQTIEINETFEYKCTYFLSFAVTEFVNKHSSEKSTIIYIVAMNDISYRADDSVCMADILVRTIVSQEKSYYGIFHIHHTPYFRNEGIVWVPTEGTTSYGWSIFTSEGVMKASWCDFINSVYPDEVKKYGCE